MGAQVEDADGLKVAGRGAGKCTARKLATWSIHRIAMAFGCCRAWRGGPTTIRDADCAGFPIPRFTTIWLVSSEHTEI